MSWEVVQWISHTIPGFPTPIQKARSVYQRKWRAVWAYWCSRFWDHETSDGRGVYYTTINAVTGGGETDESEQSE